MSLLLVLLLGGAPDVPAAIPPAAPPPASVTTIDGVPADPGVAPFAQGEVLTYSVSWKGIKVASATSTVEAGATYAGRPAMHLTASATEAKTFAAFYQVSGASDSWIDPETLSSLGYIVDSQTGSRVDKQTWTIDDEHGNAHIDRTHTNKAGKIVTTSGDYPLSVSHVQDAQSMSYYYRAFPLKVGQKLESSVFTDRKTWTLTVEVLKAEKVKTPAGTFDCLKVKPTVQGQNKGEMTVWISDDDRRLPVKMESTTPFGAIDAVLTKFTQGAAQ